MKVKIYRHALFWIAYSIQETFLEYTWLPSDLARHTSQNLIWLAFQSSLLLLPVKMIFTYWLLDLVKNAFLQKTSLLLVSIKVAVGLLISIFAYRIIANYLIGPQLYPGGSFGFRNVFILGFILISLLDLGYVSGIALALKLYRMQLVKIRIEKDLIKDKLETELKFLKNQINPHFLFNTLNNIYGLSRKKSDKTPEVVLKLSKLLRFMLYDCNKSSIPISEEIKILEDYIELEKIRYNDRLQIKFAIEIDNYCQPITPLILIPFLENAFKHGINETTGLSKIIIHIQLKQGLLNFMIANTQERKEDDTIEEKIGLSNVRRQLELMYNDFSLQINNLDDTFRVDLRINLNRTCNLINVS